MDFSDFGRALCTWAAIGLLVACSPQEGAVDPPLLEDVAQRSGLDFVHINGMSGEYFFSEMTGSGVALFDADNDGDLDIYLVQGHPLGESRPSLAGPTDRLFENVLDVESEASGEFSPRFRDITELSGLEGRGYGMGVATGDIDNDGKIDLYLTNFGANQLWRNSTGDVPVADDKTVGLAFTDITESSGAGESRWSSSATFLDFDADGWLDLFIVNYTDFRLSNHKPCPNRLGALEYCGPRSYAPETDRLLRNLGPGDDGQIRMEDVSEAAGLLEAPGPGLGVVAADFDSDGRVDIYVANDQASNQLWMNLGGGSFRDEALMRGCALDADGRAQASMGVDAADVDGDGDIDLFMTHLLSETNTLYVNDGQGLFSERTVITGLASGSLPYTGFGTAFFDLDNDGWLDLLTVNGEVRTIREQRAAGEPLPLRQPNQLFHNLGLEGEARFEEWSARAPVLATALVSRGAACGDVDNDGDTDCVVANNNGPVQLLNNRVGARNAWIGARAVGETGRDMLGARIGLRRPGKATLWRRVSTGSSYLSAGDPRVLWGLGAAESEGPWAAEVRWPSGRWELFENLEIRRYQDLVEGAGQAMEKER